MPETGERSAMGEARSFDEGYESINEALRSANEELQSVNQELELSRQELRQINDDLQSVNSELGQRLLDLARANKTLANLLESTQIPTILLDKALHVTSFTSSAAAMFPSIEAVRGPMTEFASSIGYPELESDVRGVLESLRAVQREVGDPGQGRYLVRVLPYRGADNGIAGVVLIFLDLAGQARHERDAGHASEQRE
jgi:two-component system CheB/CheR fusion protein